MSIRVNIRMKIRVNIRFLTSALRLSGKRQLDCLGIATAVLAMCHAIAELESAIHGDLAHCQMMVSDDHCWITLPLKADCAAAAADDDQRLHVEVTDPRHLEAPHMANWLYAGGKGVACSAAQVVLVLVGGLMPEEVKDSAAADQVRRVQMHLLQQLAEHFPEALLYSTFFRMQAALCGETDELLALQQPVFSPAGHRGDAGQVLTDVISDGDLLLPQLLFMDALCAYYGDESADLPSGAVKNFLTAASCFTRDARAAAAAKAAQQQLLLSSRLQTFAEPNSPASLAWLDMAADLQHLVQVPASRKRKRKNP
eukprot:gene6427-6658_t